MSTNLKYFQLLQQIEKNPLTKAAAGAFDIASDFKRDVERIAADRRLSEQGRADERGKNLNRSIRDLRDLQKTALGEHHAKTEAMRATAKRPPFDKNDFVGALNRKEFRDRSLVMNFGQKAMRLTGPRRSTAYIDAVLEFEDDPWMAGIDVDDPNQRELYEAAKAERLRDFHGPLMDQADERDATEKEVIDLVFNVVRADLQHDSGLEPVRFNEFAKQIGQNAPWILEDKKTVCELVNGKAEYHQASADELRDGVQYGSADAYLAARAA